MSQGAWSRYLAIRIADWPGRYLQTILTTHRPVGSGITKRSRTKHTRRPLVFGQDTRTLFEAVIAKIWHYHHPAIEPIIENIVIQHCLQWQETRYLDIVCHIIVLFGKIRSILGLNLIKFIIVIKDENIILKPAWSHPYHHVPLSAY